ncbi:hypothetical protein LY78DRAFT_113072 [Colletotrichum sublineola]|nr:hypothetical protein LY78DRAFT_113072 [Colletotrichum sublineola]
MPFAQITGSSHVRQTFFPGFTLHQCASRVPLFARSWAGSCRLMISPASFFFSQRGPVHSSSASIVLTLCFSERVKALLYFTFLFRQLHVSPAFRTAAPSLDARFRVSRVLIELVKAHLFGCEEERRQGGRDPSLAVLTISLAFPSGISSASFCLMTKSPL